jgi:Protein O-mannosyl-transferase TMEM260-like
MASSTKHLYSWIAGFAAFAIPAAIGIISASPEPYWLDSPEFTAAVQTLGIPHPPGHPLYVMLAKPFTLLPLGGIAFRVSLASAVFGALASFLLFKLISRLVLETAPDLPLWIRELVALAAALIAAVSPGWWFQCVRAEVYSLQILLVLGALYPLVLFCLAPSKTNERLLYVAAFVVGLGLSNHHYIMVVALPASIPVLVAQTKRLGGLGVLGLAARIGAVITAGLAPYLFLPIRSSAGAAVSLGGVHSLSDFFWVVSAKVYQKSMVKGHATGLGERTVDSVFSMMNEIGPVTLIASLLGMYLLLRLRHTRLVGIVLTLLIGITLLLRSTMGFDFFNPDYYGYMLPAVAGFVTGFAVLCAVAMDIIRSNIKFGKFVAAALAIALSVVPILRARQSRPKVDLSGFRATRLLLDLSLSNVKPNAVVLTSYYKLFFVLWSARYIDGSRPDVIVVNPMLFSYPGYIAATLRQHDDLKDLAREVIVHGNLTESAVAGLAWNRPLRIEPDPQLDDSVVSYMLPDGPLYKASPEPLSRSDVIAASPDHLSRWRTFYDLLGPNWEEHETWRMLTWCHFQDALFLARRGDRAGARQAVEMALALGSKATQLIGLKEALDDGKKGPVDITPFNPKAELLNRL